MKLIKLVFVAFITLSLYSCDKKSDLLDIKFNTPTKDFTVTADTIGVSTKAGTKTLEPDTINIDNLDSLAKTHGTSLSKIKSISAKSINITIITPTGSNFDAVESGYLEIATPGKTPSNKAKLAEFPALSTRLGASSINLTSTNVNLLEYLSAKQAVVSATITTNAGLKQKTTFKISLQGEAVANPIN